MSATRVIFLGPPGVGKGTVAQRLAEERGLRHLSSGDILRAERASGSALGRRVQTYMDQGALVPDDLMVEIMGEHLAPAAGDGYVLDGFPRTVPQAEALDASLSRRAPGCAVQIVVELNAPDEVIVERLSGREGCPRCGRIYHRTNMPPKNDDLCDECGVALTRRSDDQPDVVRRRLRVYEEQTSPLREYYQNQGILRQASAQGTPEEVAAAVRALLDAEPATE